MEYIQMNEKVKFSRIIQGFWRLTSWQMTPAELVIFMNECVNRGVTTFDTAEIYGDYECEDLIGKALLLDPTLRSKIQLVTKTGINKKSEKYNYTMGHYDTSYDKIIASCKASIAKMNCDYLDAYLIHREDHVINHKEVARAFHDLEEQGLILSAGVSNFGPYKFSALHHHTHQGLITNQIEINPTVFEHFSSGMMDYLQEVEVHPMVWSPLAGGKLFTSDEEIYVRTRTTLQEIANRHDTTMDTIAYAWLLHHPTKPLPISGSKNLARLDAAIAALDITITNEEWYEIFVASGQFQLR